MHYLGIDVSKATLHGALEKPGEPDKALQKAVPNTPAGCQALLDWCQRQASCTVSELHAVLEATGPYHEVALVTLSAAGVTVSLVNPKQVKDFAGSLGLTAKHDRQDARVLARFGRERQPRPWQPPAPAYQHLQALLKRLAAVEQDLQREQNRQEKVLAGSPAAPVAASLTRTIQFLEEERDRLRQAINEHIQQDPQLQQERALLESIPGIGPTNSALLVALFQGQRFADAAEAAAYVGLIPTTHESGQSVRKKPHLSKRGPALIRAKLYLAAVVAKRHNPDVRALYERLVARGKSKLAALGAAMRKLVHICFGVLKHQTPYQPQVAQPAA
jgi:transposase